jgi:DNA invertase Pin-like site-specific DNA recombinase
MITACYERISTANQTHNSQDKVVTDYCTRNGFENVRVFREVASGAKSRPVLDKLLDLVREKKIRRIVIFKFDRLARSTHDLLNIVSLLKHHDCELISVNDGVTTSTESPMGRLYLNLMASFSEFERSVLVQRVRAGLAAARAKGRIGGRPGLPQETKDQILHLLSQGLHPRNIASECRTSIASVYKQRKLALVS